MNRSLRALLLTSLIGVGAFTAVLNQASALSTSETAGFQTVSKGAGFPTGTPTTTNADQTPAFFDTTHGQLFCHDGSVWQPTGNYSLNTAAAAIAVTNTTTETSVYSFSVPGNVLGSTHRLRLSLKGSISTLTTSTPTTFTVKVKYGATSQTLVNAVNLASGASSVGATLIADVCALNATGTQAIYANYAEDDSVSAVGIRRASSSVDSTAAQTLTVTYQTAAANASNTFTIEHALLEFLR